MTLPDNIAAWLVANDIRVVAAVQGGTCASIVDACERHPDIKVYYAAREDQAGFFADGACRAAGRLAAATIVTTGPGVAFTLPALMTSYGDKVPGVYIGGWPRSRDQFQVDTQSFRRGTVRLYRVGLDDQETDAEWDPPLPPTEYTRYIPQCFLDWVGRVKPFGGAELARALNVIVDHLPDDALVFSDAGLTLATAWTVLGDRLGDRFHGGWQQSSMGAAVPQAMGAAAATGKVCVAIVGDGSMQYQAATLERLVHYDLPVFVVVLDNGGYGAIEQHQDNALDGRHFGTSPATGGPHIHNWWALAKAYGITHGSVPVSGLTLDPADGQQPWDCTTPTMLRVVV